LTITASTPALAAQSKNSNREFDHAVRMRPGRDRLDLQIDRTGRDRGAARIAADHDWLHA
jgi:hypothetical protein